MKSITFSACAASPKAVVAAQITRFGAIRRLAAFSLRAACGNGPMNVLPVFRRPVARVFLVLVLTPLVHAQLTDVTQTPNAIHAGIQKSYADEIGPGRGDDSRFNSSMFLIHRDPFRSIARGRQLFQRKFTQA